jgi:cytochrome c5
MRSNRRRQAGQSITEAVVATALVGITIVVALGTIDASIGGGRQAVHQAWAQCMVRETTGAIREASWAPRTYRSPDTAVRIVVTGPQTMPPPVNSVQTVTVTVVDPDSGSLLYQTRFLKAAALEGNQPFDPAFVYLASACPKP